MLRESLETFDPAATPIKRLPTPVAPRVPAVSPIEIVPCACSFSPRELSDAKPVPIPAPAGLVVKQPIHEILDEIGLLYTGPLSSTPSNIIVEYESL